VLIAVLVILLITVDVDRYKPRIEQAVHDKLDRTLKFDGRPVAVGISHDRGGAAAHHLERARYGRALPEPGPGPACRWRLCRCCRGRLAAGTASLVRTAGNDRNAAPTERAIWTT